MAAPLAMQRRCCCSSSSAVAPHTSRTALKWRAGVKAAAAAVGAAACEATPRPPHGGVERRRQRRAVVARASPREGSGGGGDDGGGGGKQDGALPAPLILLVLSLAGVLANGDVRDALSDLLYDSDDAGSVLGGLLGAGDLLAAALWGTALWFVSPLQLLLVWLGNIDGARPSDWLIEQLGRAAKLPVDEPSYVAPAWARGIAVAACAAGGAAAAALLHAALDDATWGVASGLGALFAGGIFEAGRPRRLSADEAQTLEAQWQDFQRFADRKLRRGGGRCHESEVFAAFRSAEPRYRRADVLSDGAIRDMVRYWYGSGLDRTRGGFLRNVSLLQVAAPSAAQQQRAQEEQRRERQEAAEAAAAAASGSELLDAVAEAAAAGASKQQQQQQEQEQEQEQDAVAAVAAAPAPAAAAGTTSDTSRA